MPDIKYPALAETFAVEFKSGPSSDGSSYSFTNRYVRGFSNLTVSVGGVSTAFTAMPRMDFSMNDGFSGNVEDEKFTITIDSSQLPIAYRIAGQFADIECFVYQVDQDVENAGSAPTATLLQRGFLRKLVVRAKGDPGTTELVFSSVKGFLEEYPIGVTASNLCGWRFGDTSCNAVVHNFAGVISGITGNELTTTVTGTSNGMTAAEAFGITDFFANGFITVEGLPMSIRRLKSGNAGSAVFDMFNPPPASSTYTWVGKTISISEGCNKTYDTCGSKKNSIDSLINNHRHFGGFGIRMPAFNPQTDTPQTSVLGQANASLARIDIPAKQVSTASLSLTSEWLPSAISPTAWYIADSISGSDGDSVAAWPDSSGNAHNAAQAVSSRQPTLQTRELNNHSVVRFDGSNDIVSDGDIAALDVGTGDIWLACVFKSTDDSGAQNFFEKGATSFGLRCLSNGVLQFTLGSTTNTPLQSAGNWSRTEFVLATASRVSANANGFVNGSDSTTTNQTNTGSISNSSVFDIGARAVGAGTLTGDIAEIIVGGATLATADRLRLEGYLAHKYGLQANLPNSHTYRFKAP